MSQLSHKVQALDAFFAFLEILRAESAHPSSALQIVLGFSQSHHNP
jgi:hypothetical protein